MSSQSTTTIQSENTHTHEPYIAQVTTTVISWSNLIPPKYSSHEQRLEALLEHWDEIDENWDD